MNATTRFAKTGTKFQVGQTVIIPSFRDIEHVLTDGEYVILHGDNLSVYDVAQNRETAECMANELGDSEGFVAVHVKGKRQEVQQYWRDVVADCYGLQN